MKARTPLIVNKKPLKTADLHEVIIFLDAKLLEAAKVSAFLKVTIATSLTTKLVGRAVLNSTNKKKCYNIIIKI